MTRWAVILAGGVGSRFWPLSTPERPKQLLPLVNDRSLLLNTVDRLRQLVPPANILILTNASLAQTIATALPDVPPGNIVAEPKPAGTAAALTWAALEIEKRTGPDSPMVCVHADWAIADDNAFRTALDAAMRVAAEESALVTVGVVPTRPDPGFGYIQPGETTSSGARKVTRFVEKPERTRAISMLNEGYLWNSGIFAWRVGDFLDEVRTLTPEVAKALQRAGNGPAEFFNAVIPVSVDVGVLERSKRVRVLSGDFGWDDVGTWAALRRVKPEDSSGNVTSGEVFALDARGNVVHTEGSAVVLYGVSDLVVVSKDGLTLVTTADRSADLKTLVDALPSSLRDQK
ncbi:MAG TPA: sugar phosphate nucleotidyltransferase [Gemmatimonadaceae bacterium]|nr:sugar phosphate nucleotidyltransferase [Gemmatimonadaceae bacterium]